MMEHFYDGYIPLALVAIVFFGLQVWWISMTIRNGRNQRVLEKEDQIDEIKKRLEKIFFKTATED